MSVSGELREAIYDHIDQIADWNMGEFDDEVDVINKVIDTLDGFDYSPTGTSAQIKANKMHPTPQVDFSGPSWAESNQALKASKWIDGKSAELADLLFIANRFEDGGVVNRRAMISQMKFSRGGWDWKIKMHQYHLLHNLPRFIFTNPPTGESFNLNPDNKSFTSYSFASNHYWVFFNTTYKMRDSMKSLQGIKSTTYDPTPDEPYGFQVMRGIVKRFVLGMYGETFDVGDELYRLIDHMFQKLSFEQSDSANTLSDGGTPDDENGGVAVVQMDIGKGLEEAQFDQLDEDGPRI